MDAQRNPSEAEAAAIRELEERQLDLKAELDFVTAKVQHAVYQLKKACHLSASRDVVLNTATCEWCRVIGEGPGGIPTFIPIIAGDKP